FDFFAREVRRGLTREFLCDQIKLREILAAKALTKDGREFAVFFGKKRKVAFCAADITREDQRDLLKRLKRIKSTEIAEFALWVVPLPAVAFEQDVGFFRAPTTGGVFGDGGTLCGAPDVEDRVDQRPSGFNAVGAIEKSSVTADAIVDERGIRAARGF